MPSLWGYRVLTKGHRRVGMRQLQTVADAGRTGRSRVTQYYGNPDPPSCSVCGGPRQRENKTCGKNHCRSLMSRLTRNTNIADEEFRQRRQLYGDESPWVRWEAEMRERERR